MEKKCPKCGYTRNPEDQAPEYECPKCGIVYAKYLAKLHSENAPRSGPSSDTSTQEPKRFQEIYPSLATPLPPQFKSTSKIAAACLVVIVLLTISGYFFITSDYGKLRWRYWNYIRFMNGANAGEAYPYLSQTTRDFISLPAWNFGFENSDLRATEDFHKIEFSSDRKKARIVSAISFSGEKIKYNYQTWVKTGDVWYRDLAHDQQERIRSMRTDYANKLNENSRPEIAELRTSWTTIKSNTVGRLHLIPRTYLVIANHGSDAITELRVRVDYYDTVSSSIMATVEEQVIDNSDNPLLPSQVSKMIFLNTNTGFELRIDTLDARQVEASMDRIERHLFFKRSRSAEWERLSTSHLVKQ